jgi:hypothetical protein
MKLYENDHDRIVYFLLVEHFNPFFSNLFIFFIFLINIYRYYRYVGLFEFFIYFNNDNFIIKY